MTSRQLYNLYINANAQNNCQVEEFDELDSNELRIWTYIAEHITARMNAIRENGQVK